MINISLYWYTLLQTVITEAFCAPPNVAEAYAEEGDESATSIGLSQLDSAPLEVSLLEILHLGKQH